MTATRRADGCVPRLRERDRVVRYAGDCEEVLRNPFLAALPGRMTTEDWIAVLSRKHQSLVTDEMTYATRELRIAETPRLHVPLSREMLVAGAVVRMLRFGYHLRFGSSDSRGESYEQTQQRILEDVLDGHHSAVAGQTGLAVVGVSGTGKSVTLRAVLDVLPKLLWHPVAREGEPRVIQIVWLLVDAPAGKSAKGLFLRVLSALDERLRTNYAGELGSLSADRLEERIRLLVREYSIGLLVIDEAQVLRGKGVSREKLIDHLVSLTNTSGVPIVLVGTSETRDMLRAAPQLARRTIGEHPAWNALAVDDEDWRVLVDGMFDERRLGLPFERPAGKDMPTEMHRLTEGISAILGKLLEATQLKALRLNRATFLLEDCEAIAAAFGDEVKNIIEITRLQRLSVTLSETGDPEDAGNTSIAEKPRNGKRASRKGARRKGANAGHAPTQKKLKASAVVHVDPRHSGLADMRRL